MSLEDVGSSRQAEPSRGGSESLSGRVDRLEFRMDAEVTERSRLLRELTHRVASLERVTQDISRHDETLGRAFTRIERIENEDRENDRDKAMLRETLASLSRAMSGVEEALRVLPDMQKDQARTATTVRHHARALWLMATGFVGAVLTFAGKWLLDHG